MNLRTALEVYELEGPHTDSNREPTSRLLATKVVHLHLTPEETFLLTKAWGEVAARGRGPFLEQMTRVRQRLVSLGYI